MSKFVPNPGAFYAYVTAGLGKHAGLGGAFLAIFAYWLIATATYAFLGSATGRQLARGVHAQRAPVLAAVAEMLRV
ncbi:hypothetical protein H7I76_32770, partial [Mycolicibacterium vaccae]|nr:hypothetical protein [Mycolicibacterium vaccae]